MIHALFFELCFFRLDVKGSLCADCQIVIDDEEFLFYWAHPSLSYLFYFIASQLGSIRIY